MKNRFLILSLLALAVQSASAMGAEDGKVIDEAALILISLASQGPEIKNSEIQKVCYREFSSGHTYYARLADGDMIFANFFTKGLAEGHMNCYRLTGYKRFEVPLNNNIYTQLRTLYQSQKQ